MIRDKLLMFSAAQAVTASAASTNYLDLGSARELNDNGLIELITRIHTLFVTGDAATLTVALQCDDNTSFSTPTTLLQSASAIAVASLIAGYEPLRVRVPRMIVPERYLRMYYTVGTGSFSAGKIDAELVLDRQANISYPRGYSV